MAPCVTSTHLVPVAANYATATSRRRNSNGHRRTTFETTPFCTSRPSTY
ncbi:hypothetical protein EVA_13804 [gut metagenome]|uniref:Uncharacterized protein n=1 Tax=gut metagenome TaxID=749906 RepID=J9FUB4_9ZZZZ